MEMEYASKGKANAALTTGIIGTAGVALNMLQNGGLAGIFGNTKSNCGCNDDAPISRYDAALYGRISQLEQRNALLESENFTNTKIAGMNDIYNERFRVIEAQLAQQAVTNAQVVANISCMQNSISSINTMLEGLTKTVIPITNICPQPATSTTTTTG